MNKDRPWAIAMGSQVGNESHETRLSVVLKALRLIRDDAVSLRDARDIAAEALKEFENGI